MHVEILEIWQDTDDGRSNIGVTFNREIALKDILMIGGLLPEAGLGFL